MTMNVNLSPQHEDMIRQKVASGRYTSASEVVREALRLMESQDQLRAAQLSQLQQAVQEGVRSGHAAPWQPDKIKRDGRKRRATRQK